jgi:hypothetical protein
MTNFFRSTFAFLVMNTLSIARLLFYRYIPVDISWTLMLIEVHKSGRQCCIALTLFNFQGFERSCSATFIDDWDRKQCNCIVAAADLVIR